MNAAHYVHLVKLPRGIYGSFGTWKCHHIFPLRCSYLSPPGTPPLTALLRLKEIGSDAMAALFNHLDDAEMSEADASLGAGAAMDADAQRLPMDLEDSMRRS